MEIKLNKPFAANGKADEVDTLRVKRALNRLGYYIPYEKTGMTGIPDREVFRALAAFQKDHGLQPTGWMKPEDETVAQLRLLGGRKKGEYIWCTVGDYKVRKEHAALEGQICDWEEFPAPGDESGCRCWAVPVPHTSCSQERSNLAEAQRRVKDLSNRFNDFLLELDKLYEENNQLVENAQKTLGARLVAHLLTLPFDRIGFLGELLQRFFEDIISDELIKAAENFMREREVLGEKIEHKEAQVALAFAQLNNASKELEKAQARLEECKKNGTET